MNTISYLNKLLIFTENVLQSIDIKVEVRFELENEEWSILHLCPIRDNLPTQRYHYKNDKLPNCDLQHEALYLANQYLERCANE